MLNRFKKMLGIKQYPGMPDIPELTKEARVNIAEMSKMLEAMYARNDDIERLINSNWRSGMLSDMHRPRSAVLNEYYSNKSEIIMLRDVLERYAYDEAVRVVTRNVPIERPTEPVLEIRSNGVDGINLDKTDAQMQEAAEIGELGELTLPIVGRVGSDDRPIRARVGNDDKPSLKFGAKPKRR